MSVELAQVYQLCATVLIGLAGVAIATLQYLALRQQKWIDLFDRRFDLYRKLGAACADVAIQGGITSKSADVIKEASLLAPMLFNGRIVELTESLWLIAYHGLHGDLPPDRKGELASDGFKKEPQQLVSEHWAEIRRLLLISLRHWKA